MKQTADNRTLELPMPGAKRGRGRPTTGLAMTNAERQKAYRERVKKDSGFQRLPRVAKAQVELESDLALKEMEIGQLKAELDKARKKIAGLEKEQALLIEERKAAFKAADQAREELALSRAGKDTSGQLACEVLRLEEEKRQWLSDKELLAMQGSALARKVHELETAAKRRNTSRKKKSDTTEVK